MTLLRHLLSILLLPFLVVVVVPAWLLNGVSGATLWSTAPSLDWLLRLAGIVMLVGGFGLFGWCVSLFARVGRGTLAPWDPTRTLVVIGPYRYVRNPMISGVAMLLLGEALLWGSSRLGLWACAFISINHLYFVLAEETGLEKRFGESYRQYEAHVPRWIPRLKPWSGA
jgi:protein-S-isoprenylcysteine O-methyltransferase Ste14